jgi:hypothetical protein
MTPVEFLRAVWPRLDIYCLATPRGNGAWRHWTFNTIDEAAAMISPGGSIDPSKVDVYFNIHSLREKQVPHRDPELAAQGKTQVRVQTNMLAARCFFFDLDVGSTDGKYATQAEAVAGLKEFLAATKLPVPMITSSGGGLHVYWLLTDDLETAEWRDHATHLRQLAQHYGLKADPTRTTDTASILRIAGTFNHKNPLEPRPVDALALGKETGTGLFIQTLNEAIIRAGIEAKFHRGGQPRHPQAVGRSPRIFRERLQRQDPPERAQPEGSVQLRQRRLRQPGR